MSRAAPSPRRCPASADEIIATLSVVAAQRNQGWPPAATFTGFSLRRSWDSRRWNGPPRRRRRRDFHFTKKKRRRGKEPAHVNQGRHRGFRVGRQNSFAGALRRPERLPATSRPLDVRKGCPPPTAGGGRTERPFSPDSRRRRRVSLSGAGRLNDNADRSNRIHFHVKVQGEATSLSQKTTTE